MKATTHPKVTFDVDKDFKQLLVDICQIKDESIKDYVLTALEPALKADSEELKEKLTLLKQLRNN
jgi:hypothetical protein